MADLQGTLEPHITGATVSGAVALVARGEQVEAAVSGTLDLDGGAPMTRDTIFRIASLGKPITAAAAMILVDDGAMGLDHPIARWLPELASPQVVRTPSSPVDDVVAAVRPITVRHLLASQAGWGFPEDFSLPAIQPLFTELGQGPAPIDIPPPDWINALARIPLLHQPGDGWLYNTSYDILGVLIARVSGRSFPEFLTERLFAPLGMSDTGFRVPAEARARLAGSGRPAESGSLEQVAPAGEDHTRTPGFPSGAGGLFSTADDWLAFARMLLAGGRAPGAGERVLSSESVRLMTSDQLPEAQRAGTALFLEGQSWGFGGSVDVVALEEWNVPGRYGWVGGTGTSGFLTPATGTIDILLTQTAMTSPTAPAIMRDVWTYAARTSTPAT